MKKIKFILLICILILFFNFKCGAAKKEYNHLHIVDFDCPTPLEEIKKRYKAIDYKDGDISSKLNFTTNYDEKTNHSVGLHSLDVSITNSKNFTTTIHDAIIVMDFTSPNISCDNLAISLDISKDDFVEEIISAAKIKITDNAELILPELTAKHLKIEGLDEITEPNQKYIIFVYAFDSSNNLSPSLTLEIDTYTSILKQIISKEITLEAEENSKDDLIKKFLTIYPLEPGYESIDIESNYFSTPQKSGIYQGIIKAKYLDQIQIYQFKIRVEKSSKKQKDKQNQLKILIILSCLSIFLLIIYKKRS